MELRRSDLLIFVAWAWGTCNNACMDGLTEDVLQEKLNDLKKSRPRNLRRWQD